jgi:hypothetical protein
MTTTELLIIAGISIVGFWVISLVWLFVGLAYEMLKEQDKDHD